MIWIVKGLRWSEHEICEHISRYIQTRIDKRQAEPAEEFYGGGDCRVRLGAASWSTVSWRDNHCQIFIKNCYSSSYICKHIHAQTHTHTHTCTTWLKARPSWVKLKLHKWKLLRGFTVRALFNQPNKQTSSSATGGHVPGVLLFGFYSTKKNKQREPNQPVNV